MLNLLGICLLLLLDCWLLDPRDIADDVTVLLALADMKERAPAAEALFDRVRGRAACNAICAGV